MENYRLRLITEAQPDMKLARLLNECRFDEAEVFATQFGLDLQVSINY
jgi:hypothetical protein